MISRHGFFEYTSRQHQTHHLHLIVAHIPNAEIPQRGTGHKKAPAGRVCRRVNHSFGVTCYFSVRQAVCS